MQTFNLESLTEIIRNMMRHYEWFDVSDRDFMYEFSLDTLRIVVDADTAPELKYQHVRDLFLDDMDVLLNITDFSDPEDEKIANTYVDYIRNATTVEQL